MASLSILTFCIPAKKPLTGDNIVPTKGQEVNSFSHILFLLTALSSGVLFGATTPSPPICERSEIIKKSIEDHIAGTCQDWTAEDLAWLWELDLHAIRVDGETQRGIQDSDFNGMTDLETLELRWVDLTSAGESLELKLPELSDLILDHVHIKARVDKTFFEGLPKIRNFDLSTRYSTLILEKEEDLDIEAFNTPWLESFQMGPICVGGDRDRTQRYIAKLWLKLQKLREEQERQGRTPVIFGDRPWAQCDGRGR